MNARNWIRIVVSIGLLGWFLARADLQQLRTNLTDIPAGEAFLAIGLYAAAWLVNTVKWKTLLGGHSFRSLLALTMISQFYALVLPGQLAGEVVKAWKLVTRTGESARVVTSILMDRLTGVMCLLLVGWVGARFTQTAVGAGFAPVFAVFIICLVAAAFLSRLESCRSMCRSGLNAIGNRFPKSAKMTAFLIRCMEAWLETLHSPTRLLSAMMLGLVFQGFAVLILYRIATSIGVQVALVDWCWIFTAVSLLLLLPVTVGGIGLREGGFVTLLAGLGVSNEKALACSLALFGLHLLLAAAGAVLDLALTARERSGT